MELLIQDWLDNNKDIISANKVSLLPLDRLGDSKLSFGFSKETIACSFEISNSHFSDFVIFDLEKFDSLYFDTLNFTDELQLRKFLTKNLLLFCNYK